MLIEHISVSRKQCYEQCPIQYKYRYHEKVQSNEPIADHFVYGTLIHKIVEEYIKEQGKKEIYQIALDIFKNKILLEDNTPNPQLPEQYKKNLKLHLNNLKKLSDQIGYDGYLEWDFFYDLEPPNKKCIKGFIDRLIIRDEKYFILDYKTTKKGMWRKNQNTIRNDLQLRIYSRIVQKTFNAKPENIRAALFYILDSDLISTKFTEESLEMAEKELLDTYNEIKNIDVNDIFGKTGNHCRFCQYKKICPYYSLT